MVSSTSLLALLSSVIGTLATTTTTVTVDATALPSSTSSTSTSHTTTKTITTTQVKILNAANFDDLKLSGSVIAAKPCATTYAFHGTNSEFSVPVNVTVTEGPATFGFNYSTSIANNGTTNTGVVTERCSLKGTTEATCAIYASISAGSAIVGTNTTSTWKGTDMPFTNVPVTGGLKKLAKATGTCSQTVSHTGSKGAAAPTMLVDVVKYAVAVPVGAVVVGAVML